METKQGFHSIEPLNNELTRFALIWNNTKEEGYGNVTVSKEIIDIEKVPSYLANVLTRLEIENIARILMDRNNVVGCALHYSL